LIKESIIAQTTAVGDGKNNGVIIPLAAIRLHTPKNTMNVTKADTR